MLFSSQTNPSLNDISLPSSWKRTAVLAEASSQTLPVETTSCASETTCCVSMQIQTDPEPVVPASLTPSASDLPFLVSFLSRVESDMSAILLQNIKSTAFHGYTVKWEDEIDSVSCLATFEHPHRSPGSWCTDLAWNNTGSTIATSYGRMDHASWCSHKGMICTWNISMRDLSSESFSFTAETTSCLMTIAFHPEIPSLIAGGAFNGEIIIWSTANPQDPVVSISLSSDLTHQEPVSKVIWIPSTTIRGKFDLMSVGNDGKVLVWGTDKYHMTPRNISQIMLSNIPKKIRLNTTAPNMDSPVGITSFSVSKHMPQEYILGTESGHIIKCTTTSAVEISSKQKEVVGRLPNPVVFAYSSHVGPVQTIIHSPFHRNLFLSCGSDGSLRLYNQLQFKHVLMWEPSDHPLCSVDWSPFRRTVFSGTTQDGDIHFYDLAVSHGIPVATIHATESSTQGCSNRSIQPSPTRILR
ncbi:hypothetical protein BASA83_002472 [Batrachochytrium salamandrivorans]|nr:hypothetical protein BASA83_002472 [Batrachochytrium salamandrivorans]